MSFVYMPIPGCSVHEEQQLHAGPAHLLILMGWQSSPRLGDKVATPRFPPLAFGRFSFPFLLNIYII